MIFKQLFDSATWTYTYLIADPVTKDAVQAAFRSDAHRGTTWGSGSRKILAVVGDTHSMNEALLFSAELDDIPFLQGCHKINHLMNVKTKFIQEQIIILFKLFIRRSLSRSE